MNSSAFYSEDVEQIYATSVSEISDGFKYCHFSTKLSSLLPIIFRHYSGYLFIYITGNQLQQILRIVGAWEKNRCYVTNPKTELALKTSLNKRVHREFILARIDNSETN